MLKSQANKLALRNFLSGLVVGSLGGGLTYWALAPAPTLNTRNNQQTTQQNAKLEVDAEEQKTGEVSC